jgi:hypothetical protein
MVRGERTLISIIVHARWRGNTSQKNKILSHIRKLPGVVGPIMTYWHQQWGEVPTILEEVEEGAMERMLYHINNHEKHVLAMECQKT